jgi:hypothetical protein
MGIELITGMGGTNHVDSEDVGALNAELIGNGNYLLSGCEVTMTDANTCHVAAGELLLQGRHVRIKGAGEEVSIGNGQAGYNQRYLICLVYSKATSGIETVGLQAFAGAKTTGTATDPAVAAGSILGGDTNVVVPLARLELTGLSVGTPAVMLDSVKGLVALGAETKKLGDSVSRDGEWYVAKVGSAANIVFKHQVIESLGFDQKEYVYNYDLPANCGTPVVGFVNATQWRVANARVTFPSSKEVRVVTPITKSVGSSGPDDIYYNDFDLTVICVK